MYHVNSISDLHPIFRYLEFATLKHLLQIFFTPQCYLLQGEKGDVQSLQRLELPVYDYSDCQEVYGKELVTRNHFCAGFITSANNLCNVSWVAEGFHAIWVQCIIYKFTSLQAL